MWAAAYRFCELPDAAALREALHISAREAGLVGTVLLAPEGINFMLAGPETGLQAWLNTLQQDPRLADLPLKRQTVAALPFQRLKVKLKREIVRMDQPTVRPATGRAACVSPQQLAQWLQQGHCDAGRPLLLLDTRNAFEVQAGSFAGALDWQLARFGDFPARLAEHGAALQDKTVVSFCTGGIRCEKAALWMAAQGHARVHQLEGGILEYLRQVPGAPGWVGRCVVFDERQSLAAQDL
jgi:UPF0176 protein